MRLLKIHIENFGKLHNWTLDLTDNPTVLMKENGWGKSTLAAFVKVMFYGFANEKKRGDMLERERVRYKPWQGGIYGGELSFEAGGKIYNLNRTFGAKEADDTFALYDAATNLKSYDFSEKIGEELFQIDQEAFQRTIYIAQNDCVTGATDSINAKMGNLSDNLDDINNYEKVQQVLKDLRNGMAPGRKTGSLKKLKDEIDGLKDDLRRRDAVERSVSELGEKLEKSRGEHGKLQEGIERLKAEWTEAGRFNEIRAKREYYERMLEQCKEKRTAVDDVLKIFGGKAPDAERLQEVMLDRNAMIQSKSDIQANALDETETGTLSMCRRKFAEGVPGQEVFEQGRQMVKEIENLQAEEARNALSAEEGQEVARLRQRFGAVCPDGKELDECLELWNARIEKKSGLGTKKATLSSFKILESSQNEGKKDAHRYLRYVLPVCLLAAGGILCAFELLAGLLVAAAGVICGCIILAVSFADKKNRQKETSQEPGGAALLEREIAEDEAVIAQAAEKVMGYLGRLGIACDEDDRGVRDVLYGLKEEMRRLQQLDARKKDYDLKQYDVKIAGMQGHLEELMSHYYTEAELQGIRKFELPADLERWKKEFLRLEEKEKKVRQAETQYNALKISVEEFLAEYGQGEQEDMDAALQFLGRKLSTYETALSDLEKYEQEREAFERETDVGVFAEHTAKTPRPMEEIEEERKNLEQRLQENDESLRSYADQLDEKQAELEDLETIRARLEELGEQYAKGYKYYQNLGLTADYLARAKESFSAKYMGPIANAFRKYYGMMTGEDGEEFRLDANIRLTRKEEGEQRETRAFSAGNQDLMGIALRMAFAEAMYQKEKPFLVFDDCFTNLDEEKLAHAGDFLRGVAEEYQVIYFTCHRSRVV